MLEIDTKNGHFLGIKSSTFIHEAMHFDTWTECRPHLSQMAVAFGKSHWKKGAKVPFRRERDAVLKGRRCRLVGAYPYAQNS